MHKWIQYPKKVHLDCADSEIPQFKLAASSNLLLQEIPAGF